MCKLLFASSLTIFTIFYSSHSSATEVEFSETVVGEAVSLDQAETVGKAKVLYDAACDFWKREVKAQYGDRLIYSSCAGQNEMTINYYYLCPYVDCTDSRYFYFGKYIRSEAKALIEVDPQYKRLKVEIISDTVTIPSSTPNAVSESWNRAHISYARNCQGWKKDVTEQFGDRLVFVSCGKRIDSEAKNAVKFESEGLVFYK